ncbi:hypothetical protein B0H13DRAFT_2472163 [Mycena leptocephala]|nr:hypothetical protein B0H13DRAFT_2472163 [Mycena leptocephala]
MLKAIRCNMDIKFISSGPAAKAVIYYITDYITKSQLQAHVAYAALEGAVQKWGEYDPEYDDLSSRAKRLLQKCAHSMISNQELSAQQVASYLMEYEDHFTSHEYISLYWTSLEGHINKEDPSPECYPASTVTPAFEITVPDEADPDVGPSDTSDPADVPVVDPDVDDNVECNPEEDYSPVEQDPITLVLDLSGKLVPSDSDAAATDTRSLRKFQMVHYEIQFMQSATMTVLSGPLVSHLLEYRIPVTHYEFFVPGSAYRSVLRFFELATAFVGTAGRYNRGMDGISATTTFFHPCTAQYF